MEPFWKASVIYHVSVVVPPGLKRFLVHLVPNGRNPLGTSMGKKWTKKPPNKPINIIFPLPWCQLVDCCRMVEKCNNIVNNARDLGMKLHKVWHLSQCVFLTLKTSVATLGANTTSIGIANSLITKILRHENKTINVISHLLQQIENLYIFKCPQHRNVYYNESAWKQKLLTTTPSPSLPPAQKDKKSSPKNKQLWEGGTYFSYLKTHILEDYLI